MMNCQKALIDNDGYFDKAAELLRLKGMAIALQIRKQIEVQMKV